MKKKLFFGILVIVLLIGLLLYFKPMGLAGLVEESRYIVISYQEVSVENGLPYIDSRNYNEITEDEKNRIIDVLKQYSCQRTFGTVFSDGSLTELDSRFVNIYIYDEGNKLVNTIFITSAEDISVNGKVYALKKSSLLIDDLMEIFQKS